jgi:hypothetical protein
MVSPMREKRAWPPRDRDSDGETVAAFEAAVAVVKETVVRSGEVLVSAKEDLSDHHRWLKAQTEAVQADRERHERWLQRQREREEALERREQKRAKRRAARQAAMRSIKDAVSATVLSVRSAIEFLIAKLLGALKYTLGAVAGGVAWLWGKLRDGVLYLARAMWGGLLFAGRTAQAFARSVTSLLVSAFAAISARLHALAPAVANLVSIAFGGIGARAREASRVIGRWLVAVFSWLAAKAGALTHTAGETLEPAWRTFSAKGYALAPALWDKTAKAGGLARHVAQAGTARVRGFLPASKATPAMGENAVFLPQRLRGFELGQMLIIAGTLLLVLGGLMLGGGLLLRAGTPSSSTIAAASPAEPVAWLFEQKSFPLAERSIFAWEATPSGVRIKGFAIGAVNMSDDPIVSLEGVLKPDLHDQDLKLDVIVEKPGEAADGVEAPEAAAAETAAGTIPSQAPFQLVFLFPAPEAPEDVLKASGGLLLKVNYEVAGKQKSFIQYLPPDLLEEQLAEIQAEAAKGS